MIYLFPVYCQYIEIPINLYIHKLINLISFFMDFFDLI